MPTIYLSPSIQPYNKYLTEGDEQYWMNRIADDMVPMLEHFMGNGPIAAWEPIYTGDHSFQMIPLVETAERETVTVTGNLCTGTDLVLSDADMPKMEVGDTVVFPNAGSYAAVISPMQFASQPKPAQLFLRADGTVVNTDF